MLGPDPGALSSPCCCSKAGSQLLLAPEPPYRLLRSLNLIGPGTVSMAVFYYTELLKGKTLKHCSGLGHTRTYGNERGSLSSSRVLRFSPSTSKDRGLRCYKDLSNISSFFACLLATSKVFFPRGSKSFFGNLSRVKESAELTASNPLTPDPPFFEFFHCTPFRTPFFLPPHLPQAAGDLIA